MWNDDRDSVEDDSGDNDDDDLDNNIVYLFLCLYMYVFIISMYVHVYREQTKDVGAKTPEMLEKIIAGI